MQAPKPSSLIFLRKNVQIVYAFALITLIPLAIIANTFFFIRSFGRTVDITLQRQALMVAQIFNAEAAERLDSPEKLQNLVDSMSRLAPDLVSIDVLFPEKEDFKVIASTDEAAIGALSTNVQNVLAWHEKKAIAFLTQAGGKSIMSQQIDPSGGRYWAVISPLYGEDGQKTALLAVKLSVKVVDLLTQSTLTRSYGILAITVVVIILLLILNTRMFEYAVLFKKIKEVDQMKDEFISMASHELRTPITGIRGYISLFLDGSFGKLSKDAMKNLKTVYGAVERLAELIEDLLNVSRIDQGRMEMHPQPTDAMAILNPIVEELKVQADQKGLNLTIGPATGDIGLIMADPARLKQVLVNIIGNAIKYTPKGGVTVNLTAKDKFLEIKVTDTGIGMSAKARERLFEKFYRVKTEDTEKIVGTGLGLWITKQIIVLMKGEIYVDSIEHVGTQMSVLLPFAQPAKT